MKLTDFVEGVTLAGGRGYFTYSLQFRVLRRLVDQTPLLEVRKLENLKKQGLNKVLRRLILKRWVEKISYGVYEVTNEGKTALNESNPSDPRGSRLREVRWVSAHHDLTFKFALRGTNFDRKLFCRRKDGKDYWYVRDGVTARIGKTHVFFTVYGCNASSVRGVLAQGLARARWAAGEFQRRVGARVSEVGEPVGLPHFVVVDKSLAKFLKEGLDLSKVPKEVACCKWYLDESHKGLVEFVGVRRGAPEAAGDEVKWLLEGGARKLLEEVCLLREDLRFKPSGAPRPEIC